MVCPMTTQLFAISWLKAEVHHAKTGRSSVVIWAFCHLTSLAEGTHASLVQRT